MNNYMCVNYDEYMIDFISCLLYYCMYYCNRFAVLFEFISLLLFFDFGHIVTNSKIKIIVIFI